MTFTCWLSFWLNEVLRMLLLLNNAGVACKLRLVSRRHGYRTVDSGQGPRPGSRKHLLLHGDLHEHSWAFSLSPL